MVPTEVTYGQASGNEVRNSRRGGAEASLERHVPARPTPVSPEPWMRVTPRAPSWGKGLADASGVGGWDGVLDVAVGCADDLGEVVLSEHVLQPGEEGLVGVGWGEEVWVERRRYLSGAISDHGCWVGDTTMICTSRFPSRPSPALSSAEVAWDCLLMPPAMFTFMRVAAGPGAFGRYVLRYKLRSAWFLNWTR